MNPLLFRGIPCIAVLAVSLLNTTVCRQARAEETGSDSAKPLGPEWLPWQMEVDRAKGEVKLAIVQLETATAAARQYEEADSKVEQATLELELATAKRNYLLAKDRLERLVTESTKSASEAQPESRGLVEARLDFDIAQSALQLAEGRLDAFTRWTKPLKIATLNREVVAGNVRCEEANRKLALCQMRLDHLKSLIEKALSPDDRNAPPHSSAPAESALRNIGNASPQITVKLLFEPVGVLGGPVQTFYRAKVPGGWLICSSGNRGGETLIFCPDSEYKWNGISQK